jgi:hypothetical protein
MILLLLEKIRNGYWTIYLCKHGMELAFWVSLSEIVSALYHLPIPCVAASRARQSVQALCRMAQDNRQAQRLMSKTGLAESAESRGVETGRSSSPDECRDRAQPVTRLRLRAQPSSRRGGRARRRLVVWMRHRVGDFALIRAGDGTS